MWRRPRCAVGRILPALPQSEDSEGALIATSSSLEPGARAESIEEVSPSELEKLASHALSAPGVVLGRALVRHWPKAVSNSGFRHNARRSMVRPSQLSPISHGSSRRLEAANDTILRAFRRQLWRAI